MADDQQPKPADAMEILYSSDVPDLERKIYQLYREFFAQAERRRRWSLEEDIPWGECNRSHNPAIADVVESFCGVELFLPDYVGKILPNIRSMRGRAWFAMNWGYEESKHSLALGDWLLHSGARTEEQVADFESEVFEHEWNLPVGNVRGMLCYSMTQELATWLHYRNLRLVIGKDGDLALHTLLGHIMVDERAHYDFFRKVLRLHLEADRPGTLEALREVIHNFSMPAIHMLADGMQRIQAVKDLGIFDDSILYKDVLMPMLADLGIDRRELRRNRGRSQA